MQSGMAGSCGPHDPWQNIPDKYNLGHALTAGQVLTGRGDKLALCWEDASGRKQSFTYSQLDILTDRLASSLSRLGIARGDRVFLRLPNVPEFYLAALAVSKLGGIFIPSSTQFRTAEVRYRLQDAEVAAVVTTPTLLEAVEQCRLECPALKHVILAQGKTGGHGNDFLDFDTLIAEGSESFTAAPTSSQDMAFIAYTSGTTGDPKGVVHLQRYPISYDHLIRWWHDYQPADIVACPSEMGWLLPVASTFLFALGRGLTILLYDAQGGRFDPIKWFELLARYRVTNFTAPPTVYRMLMAAAGAVKHHDLSCWRHAVSAGEPLPADTYAVLADQLGIRVLDGLGMSECMVYCYNRVDLPVRPGSCGLAGAGTQIELLDDDLLPVKPGHIGVLAVKRSTHPGMMLEYWRKPERTAEVFRGPWYLSGDVLTCDSDGYYWFQGRNDDVIKASGYRISPFEIESCLVSHPAVLEAAAVESPDEIRGRVVKAFIVLRPGIESSPEMLAEIQAHAKANMAGYKYPRRIEIVAQLPKTTSGKIKRKELRELENRSREDFFESGPGGGEGS